MAVKGGAGSGSGAAVGGGLAEQHRAPQVVQHPAHMYSATGVERSNGVRTRGKSSLERDASSQYTSAQERNNDDMS